MRIRQIVFAVRDLAPADVAFVIDDGGECSRSDKAGLVADWPEAMRHLHVCFGADAPGTYRNCCKCEKCVRTILAFRVAGRARPEAFAYDPTDADIRRVRVDLSPGQDSPDKRALLARYEQRGLPLVVLHKPSGEAASKVTSFVEAERLLELMREARTL